MLNLDDLPAVYQRMKPRQCPDAPTEGVARKQATPTRLPGVALIALAVVAWTASGFRGIANGGATRAVSDPQRVDDIKTVDVPGLAIAPGDVLERRIDVNADHADVVLTVVASPTSLLDLDEKNGLQLRIDACPVRWHGETAPYSCDAASTRVRPWTPLRRAGGLLAAIPHAEDAHLLVSVTLPTTADNRFQGRATDVKYMFVSLRN